MSSKNAGHFFQTSSSIEEIERRKAKAKNKNGKSIKTPSKLLTVAQDLCSPNTHIFVAEAAGNVRHVKLEDGSSNLFRGPQAPVISLAQSSPNARQSLIYAGCWDKTIWSWTTTTRAPYKRFIGHSDFVKALVYLPLPNGQGLLVSGSADATITVWDALTAEKLHVLKGHTRGILDLALDPLSPSPSSIDATFTVFSAGSDREIRRWSISRSSSHEITPSGAVPAEAIIAHETSVDALHFDSTDEADLWTASADKSAKCLVRSRNWECDTTLPHPDFVRDIVVSDSLGYVVTACRDEEVRVWEKGSGKLYHVFSGHYEEVTGLCLVEEGKTVVSISIDGTVRQWSLEAEDLKKAREEAQRREEGVEEEEMVDGKGKEGTKLTEDEERELAELMDDDE